MTNSGKYAMTLVMLTVLTVMVGIASQYPPQARFMPFVIGIPAMLLCLLQLYLDFRNARRPQGLTNVETRTELESAQEEISRIAGRKTGFDVPREPPPPVETTVGPSEKVRRELIMWSYFAGFVGAVLLFGFLPAIPVFVLIFLRHWAKTSWRFALASTAISSIVLYWIFVQKLKIVPHPGLLTAYVLERLSG